MKRRCALDHNFIVAEKVGKSPPLLTVVGFTNNEETESMCVGKNVFLIQQAMFFLTEDSQWY